MPSSDCLQRSNMAALMTESLIDLDDNNDTSTSMSLQMLSSTPVMLCKENRSNKRDAPESPDDLCATIKQTERQMRRRN